MSTSTAARLESWTSVAPCELTRLAETEIARWRDVLQWDAGSVWVAVEDARRAGRLSGVVARSSEGELRGYTYWAARHGEVHCGALAATTAEETALLLDALVAASETASASRVVFFAFSDAPGLADALAVRRFTCDAYAYLTNDIGETAGAAPTGRPWDVRDLDATADLLRASYPAGASERPFAPTGSAAEWRRYVDDLVLGHGCGRCRSSLSLALPGTRDLLEAVALVTDIGEGSAHLAQLAVHPSARGAGVAARIVDAVRAQCAAAGYRRLTLLVREGNRAAERLYARLGFERRAQFTSAVRAVVATGRADKTPGAAMWA